MASPGRGSRLKGANFEREIAKKLTKEFDVDVRRTGAQERWKSRPGDVNVMIWQDSILKDFVWELKNREAWSLLPWYKKVKDEATGSGKKPVVVCTKNHEKEYVFMELDDFTKILKELDGFRDEERKKDEDTQ